MHSQTFFPQEKTKECVPVKKNISGLIPTNNDFTQHINDLIANTNSPYTASLPLMASAELGNKVLYYTSLTNMLKSLKNLNENPLPADADQSNQWMQNNSFKAWMWGRVLLATDSMNDKKHVTEAQEKLNALLNAEQAPNNNPAFFAWARAYLAALNKETYDAQKQKMLDEGDALTLKYSTSQSHDDLSNALWAWVMDIQAAALVNDEETYGLIKNKIISINHEESVADALNKGLLRSERSNDYPAWAMAKVLLAASRMHDAPLMASLSPALSSSIIEAKNMNQTAEATLAELDQILADNVATCANTESRKMKV